MNDGVMSDLGHSRRFGLLSVTSGLPQTADITRPGWHFAFVPLAAVSRCSELSYETGHGREMIDLLAVEESLSRRRCGRYRTRQRSTSCSNACGRLVRP